MTENRARYIIRKAEQDENAFSFHHPLGKGGSELTMTPLAKAVGLNRVGVNLGRVPKGKEAFICHRHNGEEEWVYILEGSGLSDIDDVQEEVGAGDFIAYPEGVAHTLKNIGEGDLIYLMGGEQTSLEIADFPRHGKRILHSRGRFEFVDESAIEPFVPDLQLRGKKKSAD